MIISSRITALLLALSVCLGAMGRDVQAEVPVEEAVEVEYYGSLPNIRNMTISPDGLHYAFIQRVGDGEQFTVVNAQTSAVVGAANASSLKARSVYFATNRHVILMVSKTRSSVNIRGKWEQTHAVVFNLDTREIKNLLDGYEGLFEAQSGLGRIVGINREREEVYMPAFVGRRDPANHLLRVDLNSGRGRIFEKGTSHTRDWFLSSDGTVLAREDFDDKKNVHTVISKISDRREPIYANETEIPEIAINAITADGKYLIFNSATKTEDALYKISLVNGEIDGPLYDQIDRDIDNIITDDLHREFVGVQLSGPVRTFEFANAQIANSVNLIMNSYPTSSVNPVSANQDWSKIIFKVSGNQGANDYVLFEPGERKLTSLARGYPNIQKEQIAEITAVRYPARDGLKIPAILTWPVNRTEKTMLPLLVFPHGGPESYDRIQFDWWAQYFARRGYLILQPNFRGSKGYGSKFRDAGRGEWGRKMQDDISDGVDVLVKEKYADPNRICIMGASYGGYAALAGGAYTPELYRCIISVAGVSDLTRMLQDERRSSGKNHWVVTYWQRLIGDSKTEREKLRNISPVNSADAFRAPVLLIHGKDDSVVPLHQSLLMQKALTREGKSVELVKLDGEDHWLSSSSTRLATLRTISTFLDRYNPVQPE